MSALTVQRPGHTEHYVVCCFISTVLFGTILRGYCIKHKVKTQRTYKALWDILGFRPHCFFLCLFVICLWKLNFVAVKSNNLMKINRPLSLFTSGRRIFGEKRTTFTFVWFFFYADAAESSRCSYWCFPGRPV